MEKEPGQEPHPAGGEENLTDEDPGEPAAQVYVDEDYTAQGSKAVQRVDHTVDADRVRQHLSYALLALLAVVALGSMFIAAVGLMKLQDVKTLLEVVFTPIVALTGTVLGFYFGGGGGKTRR